MLIDNCNNTTDYAICAQTLEIESYTKSIYCKKTKENM